MAPNFIVDQTQKLTLEVAKNEAEPHFGEVLQKVFGVCKRSVPAV